MSTRTGPYLRQEILPQLHSTEAVRYAADPDWLGRSISPVSAEARGDLCPSTTESKIQSVGAPILSVFAASRESLESEAELKLLRRTAELANTALCLSEGIATVQEFLARELGWIAVGWRVFGDRQRRAGNGYARGSSVELWQLFSGSAVYRPEAAGYRPLLLQIADEGRLLAVLAFQALNPEVSQEREQLLAQVGRQLLMLARRDVFSQGVLAREFEILRQGQLAGMAELAQGLSHELSQPLTALTVYAGALQRRLAKKEASESKDISYLGECLMQQAERAGAILQAAKGFILQRTCATGSVDIETTVRQLKKLVQPSIQAASVDLQFDIAAGLPPARGNESHVVQMVLGLLANAMVALQPIVSSHRWITVQVARVEREIRITVADSGQHAAEQLGAEQLPFFAAYSDSNRVSLAITRSLAEIQGGRLWREDRVGETAFSIALPLVH